MNSTDPDGSSPPRSEGAGGPPRRVCFVTVGATAPFDALIEATCANAAFRDVLRRHGFTELVVQYGRGGRGAALVEKARQEERREEGGEVNGEAGQRLAIDGFALKEDGLDQELRSVKEGEGRRQGVVVSHAGSGTILAALRLGATLIAVPNPALLDDHQRQLAEVMAEQGYLIHGQIDNLPAAILAAEELRRRHTQWPPVNSGQHRRANGVAGLIDEEVGWLD
ncbi:hypothetical protein BDY21DRAFT_340368 [Lineolata rhizophorae]|uniref:UDP-N-acetylglucosamine transferase subunit ALG13 n=1 Tax=Lineolata rhizophorae TaxID=578093 RepID=A0A6A6P384_9PEZI|nr:hypothetical protein BDY21DRAFT_340368 [Lineolata rhizophorae]